MIYPGRLTEAQQATSRRYWKKFSLVNGIAYMCLGETVIILFAVRLGCPDYYISSLGAMVFFGYLLLPLGKWTTARIGAARSQATFWVLRNIAVLLVASTSAITFFGGGAAAGLVLLTGAFLFYGFRAAGVVMGQPLMGEITTEQNRADLLGASNGLFYAGCLLSLTAIFLLLQVSQSLWMLTAVIVFGAALGITSSRYIRRVDETENLRRSARKPLWREFGAATANRRFVCQVIAGFAINLSLIMTAPISMLTLKRGYGVSDTGALLFSLAQFGAAAVMSQLAGRLAARIGPRRVVLAAYLVLVSIPLWWLLAPADFRWWYMLFPFFVLGAAGVAMGNSMAHYFLQAVPVENRVASSMIISVITGACAGVAGMPLAGGLLRLAARWGGDAATPLTRYRLYFALALAAMLPGVWLVSRLRPLPEEKAGSLPDLLRRAILRK